METGSPHGPVGTCEWDHAGTWSSGFCGDAGPLRSHDAAPKVSSVMVSKVLTYSDVSTEVARTGRVVLPRLQVQRSLELLLVLGGAGHALESLKPGVPVRVAVDLAVYDTSGLQWVITLKTWQNVVSGENRPTFVLENTASLVKAHRLQQGCLLALCAEGGRVVVRTGRHSLEATRGRAAEGAGARRSKPAAEGPVIDGATCTRTSGCQKAAGHKGFCMGHQGFAKRNDSPKTPTAPAVPAITHKRKRAVQALHQSLKKHMQLQAGRSPTHRTSSPSPVAQSTRTPQAVAVKGYEVKEAAENLLLMRGQGMFPPQADLAGMAPHWPDPTLPGLADDPLACTEQMEDSVDSAPGVAAPVSLAATQPSSGTPGSISREHVGPAGRESPWAVAPVLPLGPQQAGCRPIKPQARPGVVAVGQDGGMRCLWHGTGSARLQAAPPQPLLRPASHRLPPVVAQHAQHSLAQHGPSVAPMHSAAQPATAHPLAPAAPMLQSMQSTPLLPPEHGLPTAAELLALASPFARTPAAAQVVALPSVAPLCLDGMEWRGMVPDGGGAVYPLHCSAARTSPTGCTAPGSPAGAYARGSKPLAAAGELCGIPGLRDTTAGAGRAPLIMRSRSAIRLETSMVDNPSAPQQPQHSIHCRLPTPPLLHLLNGCPAGLGEGVTVLGPAARPSCVERAGAPALDSVHAWLQHMSHLQV